MESSGRSRLNGRIKDCVGLSPAKMFRVMYTLSDDVNVHVNGKQTQEGLRCDTG